MSYDHIGGYTYVCVSRLLFIQWLIIIAHAQCVGPQRPCHSARTERDDVTTHFVIWYKKMCNACMCNNVYVHHRGQLYTSKALSSDTEAIIRVPLSLYATHQAYSKRKEGNRYIQLIAKSSEKHQQSSWSERCLNVKQISCMLASQTFTVLSLHLDNKVRYSTDHVTVGLGMSYVPCGEVLVVSVFVTSPSQSPNPIINSWL